MTNGEYKYLGRRYGSYYRQFFINGTRLRAGRRQRRSYGFRQLAGVLCLILSLKQSAMRFFNTVIVKFLLGWLRRVLLRQRSYRKRQS